MTSGAQPVLAVRALTVDIGGKSICKEMSLAFEQGQCWAILGLNGAGKTTLIHTLAGVRPPDSGEIMLDGRPLGAFPRREVAQNLALLAQDSFDAFDASVLETALIGRHPHTPRWRWLQWESRDDHELAHAALAAVDLEGLAMRRVSTLSGGERERLAIASVLTQEPRVILLDEPTSHLDAHHQVAVLELFARKARDEARTVIMSLHDASLAARYCTHALLLFLDGETRAGPVADVLGAETLTRLYRHAIREIRADGLRLFVPA
jgi:iron complex transport system ATP-binding protein